MRFRKRGLIWHVRFTIDGTRHSCSTGCTDRKAAEARAKELERRAADPAAAAHAAAASITVQCAAEVTQAHYDAEVKAGNRAQDTADFYERKLGHVARVLGTLSVVGVGPAEVDRYVRHRREEKTGDHTIHKELGALKVMLGIAKRRGWWKGDLDALTPEGWSSGYAPRERALSLAEVQSLCVELGADRAAQVAYSVATSAELGAVERAERPDYKRAEGLVYVRGTKRESRDRHVPVILPQCRDLLAFALANAQGTDGLLFRPWAKNWRDLAAACVRAGIDTCTFNDLRRTFAHWHLEAGCSFEDVARAMGHVDTTMLMRVYGNLRPEALRDRMARVAGPPVAQPQGDLAHGRDGMDDPRKTKTPSDEGVSRYRRSELNQRPWDYDSPAPRALIRHKTGDGRVEAGERRQALGPLVAHENENASGDVVPPSPAAPTLRRGRR